jgi:hypothetical protein
MRLRTTLMVGFGAMLIVLVAMMNVPPTSRVQADNVLQDMPSLEGYQIYFTEAVGESSRFDRTDIGLSRFAGLLELLGADLYTLEWRNGVPPDADLLVIPGPIKDLTPEQTAWLWVYMQGHGRVLLLAESPFAGFEALKQASGLMLLMWAEMGARARNDMIVIEGELREVIVPGTPVKAGTPTNPPQPPVQRPLLIRDFVTVNLNRQHPIMDGLDGNLAFFGARSLEVDETPRESQVTTLVSSDSSFYGEVAFGEYLATGDALYNIGVDTTRTALVLAAAMEDDTTGTRLVIVGDRDFATNGKGLQTSPPYSGSFLYPDNVRFLLNATIWLIGVEGSVDMSFPTPGPSATPTTTPSPTPPPAPTAPPEPAS